MSLLRRRLMMMAQTKQQEENIVYIDSGFLPMSGTVDVVPMYNETFPTAFSTTTIPITIGDVVAVEYDKSNGGALQRIRVYDKDGNYVTSYVSWNKEINTGTYIRLLSTTDAYTIKKISIQKADGSVVNYKIIDRR